MCRDILISLHPKHCEKILAGTKTAELRRRPVRVTPGTRIWIYTKLPTGSVNARAVVEEVYEGPHNKLWERFGPQLAISRADFDQYMSGATVGCAIVLRSVVRLHRAVALEELRRKVRTFHPPQFFKRLHPECEELAVLAGGQRST